MKDDEYLEQISRGRYRLKAKTGTVCGVVELQPQGFAYVNSDEVDRPILVSSRNLNNAMDGDKVKVHLYARRKKHDLEGEVTEIVERAKTIFVGTVQMSRNFAFLLPAGKVGFDIFIAKENLNGAKDGQKAIAEIIEWPPKARSPFGKITEVLGDTGNNDAEMHAILAEFELPHKFPEKVDKVAEKIPLEIPEEEYKKRRDFREVTTFTIDPADAKDFDGNYFLSICKTEKSKMGFSKDLKNKLQENSVVYRTTKDNYSSSNPLNIKALQEAKENEKRIYFKAEGDYFAYDKEMNKIIKISEASYENAQTDKKDEPQEGILKAINTNDYFGFDSIETKNDISEYVWTFNYYSYPYNQFENITALIGNYLTIKNYSKSMILNPSTDEIAYYTYVKGRNSRYDSQEDCVTSRNRKKFKTGYNYKGYLDTKNYKLLLAENGSFHIYDYKSHYIGTQKVPGSSNYYSLFEGTPYVFQNINIGTSSYTELSFVDYSKYNNKITIGTKTGIVYEYDIDTKIYTKIELEVQKVLDSGALLLKDNKCYHKGITFDNCKDIFLNGILKYRLVNENRYYMKSYYYFSITPINELYVTTYSRMKLSSGYEYPSQINSIKIADNVKKLYFEDDLGEFDGMKTVYEDMDGNLVSINYGVKDLASSEFERCLGFSINGNIQYVSNFGNPVRVSINGDKFNYLIVQNGKLHILNIKNNTNVYIGTDYATLSGVDYKTLIGENEIINISPRNKVHDNIPELVNSIYLDYKDYSTSSKMYVLLDEEIELDTIYADYESDPLYQKNYSQIHVDPNYFENSLGKDPSISENLLNPRLKFHYVGKYEIYPHVRDNPKDDDRFDNYRLWNQDGTKVDVYVHRKPVALMKFKIKPFDDKYKVTFEDNGSYDLDRLSEYNNGISSFEFSIKEGNEDCWEVFPSKIFTKYDIEKFKNYKVAYRVKDREGVWSDYIVKEIYLDDNPIEITAKLKTELSKFNVMGLPVTEKFELYDIETKYNGDLELQASLYGKNSYSSKYNILINQKNYDGNPGNIFLKVPKEVADTECIMKLKATDKNNSAKYSEIEFPCAIRTPIDLIPYMDNEISSGEEIKITCQTSKYTDKVNLTLYDETIYENNYDMVKISEDRDKAYWEYNYMFEDHIADGNYKASFVASVMTNPEKQEKAYLTYKVNNLSIKGAIIWGDWNHWRGQRDFMGKNLENNPLRFLSYEKIYFEVTTSGSPERVYVRFSPELEAMTFTDIYGNQYSYQEHLGYEEEFPIELKKSEDNKWLGEYILPLAESTISWKDQRKRQAYWAKITAQKGTHEENFIFSKDNDTGIEITGNTLDLVIPQPIR